MAICISYIFDRSRIDPFGSSVINSRVWPLDLDSNVHMNNGRYLCIMDLGRLDLMVRLGMIKSVLKNKWMPVLSAATIRYRISLNPFQKFKLETRVVWWDDKWFYMEQRFIISGGNKDGAVAAIAFVKGSFYDRKEQQTVPTSILVSLMGLTENDTPIEPDYITSWKKSEDDMRILTKEALCTPAARYQASIDLWDKITNARVPMDGVCGDYFRMRRFIGSKDRAEIAARAYDMMRTLDRLSWWCTHVSLPHTARSFVLVAAILIDGKTIDELPDLFNGNKYHPEELTGDEIEALKKLTTLDHKDMPENIMTECPPWAYNRLKDLFGDTYVDEMAAMLEPANLDIRVNTLKIDRGNAGALLAKDDIETTPCPYSPVGLRLKSKAYLAHSKAFKKGYIEIQDEGSQLLALICNAQPGMQVLDYCAGGGGKTLALAAQMQGKGRIVAMDIEEKRLVKSKPRLTKADVHNVELRPILDDKHRKWFKRQKDKFDIVLIDAPCSSSGTWRRNPDLKWHHYGPTHASIQDMQVDILSRVYSSVKIGGRLIYATCSLFKEENENQVEAFLKDNTNFKLIPAPQAWAETGMKTPCPVESDYLRLSPAKHKTDGFFAAILERTS